MSTVEARNRGRNARRSRLRVTRPMLEGLEKREVLSYSALGYSLPDLTVTGQTGAVAAWGQPLEVTVDVHNIGASSIIEPLNLEPNATSTADAPATTVTVLAVPRGRSPRNAIALGQIAIPSVIQNSDVRVTQVLNMPARPAGYPGSGGRIDIYYVVNGDRAFLENDFVNNSSRGSLPVLIQAALPDIQTIALDVPPVMNPGDAIQPNIRLGNFGTANTNLQGPLLVQLVASLDRNFGPGDQILGSYTIDSINPVSLQPSTRLILNDSNLDPGDNITTLQGLPVTLPASPQQYFLGVIVDPNNTIKELREVGRGASFRLQQVRVVGPNRSGLPPAGVITPFNPGVIPLFPYPGVTSTGQGTTVTINSAAPGALNASNSISSSTTDVGGLQVRALNRARRRGRIALVEQPIVGEPTPGPAFATNQIGSSEQDGGFLFPQKKVPTTTTI
ncbi:MAG: hypothetical protein SFX72_15230 [Isosphaeraceae bacterium]|nr:hypothetical protein [Isosphaeraceae bacterium]